MHIRLATATIRHHTILAEPMVLYLRDGQALNQQAVETAFHRLVRRARLVAAGRLRTHLDSPGESITRYNPLGYGSAAASVRSHDDARLRDRMMENRCARLASEARRRLDDPYPHPDD
jgi:hypothetical protein